MKKLSVIIVTYLSEHDIYDCLETVWAYRDIPEEDLEVIIVDNSPESGPMFENLKERYGNHLHLIRNTHNGGYGQGNNVGIKAAEAPVVLIMNPDVRLCQPIFSAAVKTFQSDPDLSILGMKQMLDSQRPSPYSFTCTYMMNGYLHTLLSVVGNRLGLYLPRWMHFSGSCFFLNREKFEDIGLFDESIFMYGEEDDIHYRMRQRYPKMKFNRHLRYIHPFHLREPNLDYEKTIVQVAIKQNEKKGYTREKTVKNRLRNLNCLIWGARIRCLLRSRKDEQSLCFLEQRRQYLKSLI
ncbi:MAG: glycosyltransferase [Bacteroidaceae bacterium]|nr:glycosyltransferase [Bacteroidaceae bacterium]